MAQMYPISPDRSVMPTMAPNFYRSYGARFPRNTHSRPATCAEYECDGWRFGFTITVDLDDELGQRRYHFLTHDKTRRYTEQRLDMTTVKLVYDPGQECFTTPDSRGVRHRISLERPPVLLAANGDWRGYTTPVTVHTRAEFWVEDMQEQFEALGTLVERG